VYVEVVNEMVVDLEEVYLEVVDLQVVD